MGTSRPPAKPGGCWFLGPEHTWQEIWFRAGPSWDLAASPEVSPQAKVVERIRAGCWGKGKPRALHGSPAGQAVDVNADTGWARCACKPGSVFERRCRFGMGAGLSSWKHAEKRVLKRILKNCHSGLMRGLALRPGLRRTGFRRQQNNSGCVSKKLPGTFLECRTDAMQVSCRVAAVWVYRGSVVEVVKGEPLQATRLERRSYCGSDRPARLKSLSSRVFAGNRAQHHPGCQQDADAGAAQETNPWRIKCL